MRTFLFSILVLISTGVLNARDTKFDILYCSDKGLSVDNCIFTDTATVITLSYCNTPYSWFTFAANTFACDESGERHKVIRAEGLKLNEEQCLGDDGRATFTLFFAPLPTKTAIFDIIEGPFDNGFKIYGIHKKRTKLKISQPKECIEKSEIDAKWFMSDTAVIRGFIVGYDRERMPSIVQTFYSSDAIHFTDGEKYPNCAKIEADGSFTLAFRMDQPKWTQIQIGDNRTLDLYIRPSDTLNITIERWGEWDEKVTFVNPLERLTLANLMTNYRTYLSWEKISDAEKQESFSGFLEYLSKLDKEGIALLSYLSWKYHFTEWENHLLFTNWRLRILGIRQSFQRNKLFDIMLTNQHRHAPNQIPVPQGLKDYSFLSDMQWNDTTIVLTPTWITSWEANLKQYNIEVPANKYATEILQETEQKKAPPFSTYRMKDERTKAFIDSIVKQTRAQYIEIAFFDPTKKNKITENYISSLNNLTEDFKDSGNIQFVIVTHQINNKGLREQFMRKVQFKGCLYIECDDEDFLHLQTAFRQTSIPFVATINHEGEVFRWPLFLNSEKNFRDVFRELIRQKTSAE